MVHFFVFTSCTKAAAPGRMSAAATAAEVKKRESVMICLQPFAATRRCKTALQRSRIVSIPAPANWAESFLNGGGYPEGPQRTLHRFYSRPKFERSVRTPYGCSGEDAGLRL